MYVLTAVWKAWDWLIAASPTSYLHLSLRMSSAACKDASKIFDKFKRRTGREFDLSWLGREVKEGILLKLDDWTSARAWWTDSIPEISTDNSLPASANLENNTVQRNQFIEKWEKKTCWRNSRLMNGRSRTKLGISRPGYLNVTSQQSASGFLLRYYYTHAPPLPFIKHA